MCSKKYLYPSGLIIKFTSSPIAFSKTFRTFVRLSAMGNYII